MAYGLWLYEIKENIKEVKYEDTENYQVVKAFINNPKKMLRELLR